MEFKKKLELMSNNFAKGKVTIGGFDYAGNFNGHSSYNYIIGRGELRVNMIMPFRVGRLDAINALKKELKNYKTGSDITSEGLDVIISDVEFTDFKNVRGHKTHTFTLSRKKGQPKIQLVIKSKPNANIIDEKDIANIYLTIRQKK